MQELQTIQQIFNNKIFRIPDFQRGFSWNEKHLEAFWQDLENLQENKLHFTGAITVERATEEQYSKWEDDQWIINGKNFSPFYIIDGQQRLTTVIILIFTICDKLKENENLLYCTKSEIFRQYIYNENDNNNLKSYIFGYDIDNPSFDFLKSKIFSTDSLNSSDCSETIYTNNLMFAKQYFAKKISNFDIKNLELLFKKVTQKIKFDFQEIDKELDIYVVFETMNNRGKPLSNLELLKNRFIYLTTLLPNSDSEKKKLRRDINDTWKTIYQYLGKDKSKALSDDEFLKAHWIMYHRFTKEEEFYKKDIFDIKFTVKELVEGHLEFSAINEYILSLQKSVKQWYIIKKPVHAFEKEVFSNLDKEIVRWLDKLNRLGFTNFEPLTLAVFCKNHSKELVVEYLKCIELFIFCVFKISNKQSNTEQIYAYTNAKKLFKGEEDVNLKKIICDIRNHLGKSIKLSRFVEDMIDGKGDFYKWKGINYFLYEYEENLQGKNVKKIISNDISIEHIFPQKETKDSKEIKKDMDPYWETQFQKYDLEERKILCHSLGNLLLLQKGANSEYSNKSFANKKKGYNSKGHSIGYYKGSYSENEVNLYEDWNAQSIKDRGEKLIKYMQERWYIKFSKSQIGHILQLDFVK